MSNNDVNSNPYANAQFAPQQAPSGAAAQAQFDNLKKECRSLVLSIAAMSILGIASLFLALVQDDGQYSTLAGLGDEANVNIVWILPIALFLIALACIVISYVIPKDKVSARRALAFVGAAVFLGNLVFYLWATLAKVYTVAEYYSFTVPECIDIFDMDFGAGFFLSITAGVIAIISSILLALRYGKFERRPRGAGSDLAVNPYSVQPSYGSGLEGQGAFGAGLAGQTPYGSPIQTQAPYSPNPQPIATAPYYGAQSMSGTQQVSGSANTETAYSPLASYGAYGARPAPAQLEADARPAPAQPEADARPAPAQPEADARPAPAQPEAGPLGDGVNGEPVADHDVEEQAIADTRSPNEGQAFNHIQGNTYGI